MSGVHSVVFRNGAKAYVSDSGRFEFEDEDDHALISLYNEDLINAINKDFDVIQVLESKPLWQREEKEMIEIDGVEYEKVEVIEAIETIRVRASKEKPIEPKEEPKGEKEIKGFRDLEEKKKFVIEYGSTEDCLYSIINADSVETRLYYDKDIDESFLTHGRYRKTRANAEYSQKRNQIANRLEALVECLQDELGIGGYCIFKGSKGWRSIGCASANYAETILMTEKTAVKICEILNNEEYSLEGWWMKQWIIY